MQGLPDRSEHALGVQENLSIREAELVDALRADESAAPTIVSLLDVGSMLTAVELDRESSSGAVEVQDIGPQRMLSAKLE